MTVAVGDLSRDDVELALAAGTEEAEEMWRRGLIDAAFLCLDGHYRTVSAPLSALPTFGAAKLGDDHGCAPNS